MIVTQFPKDKIKALHKHLQIRRVMTTASINLAVLGRDPSPDLDDQLNKVLQTASAWLDIEPVQRPGEGLYWRRREKTESEPQSAPVSTQPVVKAEPAAKAKPATKPTLNRDWSLDGELMLSARQIARELGAQGIAPSRGNLPTAELARRLGEQIGSNVPPNAFAPSSLRFGGKWRDDLEEDYQKGRKDYLAKIAEFRESKEAGEDADATPSILTPTGPLPEPEQPEPAMTPGELVEAITELQEIVCSSSNGNGNHPADDEPSDQDLTLIEEVTYLESELEESRREVQSLQRRLEAAFAAAKATPQQPTQDTLQGILDALEAQLEQAKDEQTEAEWRRNEAATRIAALSEKLTAARQLVQVLES